MPPATLARHASPANPATPAFPANPGAPATAAASADAPQSGSRTTAAAAFPQRPSRLRVVREVGSANRGGRRSPSAPMGYMGGARQHIRGSATRYSWLAGPSATRYSRHPRRDIRGNLSVSTGAAKRLQQAAARREPCRHRLPQSLHPFSSRPRPPRSRTRVEGLPSSGLRARRRRAPTRQSRQSQLRGPNDVDHVVDQAGAAECRDRG